ncbi:MAG: gliding motility-associated C-terminal domain-containing protein, partial [Bacteroidales bacterium]|nr:gliding motility-associated C-terminal domain-containing protein [Bacteroidales bacterium]
EFFIDGISVQGPGVINTYITNSLNDGETVTVEVLDTITGCSAVSSGITISVPPVLTITPTSDITLLCYDDSTASGTFTASGGTAPYLFTVDVNTAGASIGASTATDISFTHGGVGEVTVNVIDNNGCTATSTITVTEPANLVISSTKTNVTCYGESDGTIDISVTGGTTNYSYAWSHGPTTEDIINLTEDTYTVVVTDANGCTIDTAITISEPPALVINHVNTDVTCNNRNDGAINITASGGAGPYTYSWSHGPTFEDLTGLTAGDYTITVTDANSCTLDSTFTIYEPAAWDVSVSVTDVTCYGENNGRAAVSVSGGIQPYNYLWSDGQTGQIVENLFPIDYSVTITDAIGCSWVEIMTIAEPLPITTEIEITDASCPGIHDGAIMLNISGGTTPYTVLWSNSATTIDLTNITDGKYTVEITDANLCTKTDSATVGIFGENCVTEIPTIITPNGDGMNDVWRIENIQLYSNATIEVYTRWGKLVYRSDDGNQDPWDGTFKGKELPMDSYHYIIDLGDGSKPIIGSVTIVR